MVFPVKYRTHKKRSLARPADGCSSLYNSSQAPAIPYLIQALEQVRIKHLGAAGLIEAFDVSVLVQFIGRDVAKFDIGISVPRPQRTRPT